MIKAELIAIGSELLTPFRMDTNTLWLTEQLNGRGITVTRKHVIGDDRHGLADLLRAAGKRASLIICCGGLGPTFDDISREALADALGLELIYHEEIWDWIEKRYKIRGRMPTENNRRQAMVPEGAIYFKNEVGTAPGLLIRQEGITYALLPGPPVELQRVFSALKEELFKGFDIRPVYQKKFKLVAIPESAIDDRLQGVLLPEGMEWSILASYGEVEIHFRIASVSVDEAARSFKKAEKQIRSRFGSYIFGVDEETLEEVVGQLLRAGGHTIVTAESCTGGWLAKRLTDVSGSSDYFKLGYVCYSNEAKIKLLGISERMLEKHGAVSIETALEMARGARERSRSDISVAVTGIAGPSGGSKEKPVGLVIISAIGADAKERSYPFLFPGDREKIRFQATQMALAMVRASCIGEEFRSIYIIKN